MRLAVVTAVIRVPSDGDDFHGATVRALDTSAGWVDGDDLVWANVQEFEAMDDLRGVAKVEARL